MTEAIDRAERAADASRVLSEMQADRRHRAVRLLDARVLRTWVAAVEPTRAEADVGAYLRTQLPDVPEGNMRIRFIGPGGDRVVPPPLDPASRAGAPALAANVPDVRAQRGHLDPVGRWRVDQLPWPHQPVALAPAGPVLRQPRLGRGRDRPGGVLAGDDLADSGAAIRCDCPSGLIVRCKRLAIKRAVTNLIENALRYGHEAQVRTARVDGRAVISVEDRGPGLPASQIDAVVAPFYRGDRSRSPDSEGVGLGLSIAQIVAEDHGGELRLGNRSEGGLRAELVLPLHPPSRPAAPDPTGEARA